MRDHHLSDPTRVSAWTLHPIKARLRPSHPLRKHRQLLSKFGIFLSVALTISACQTAGREDAAAKQQSLLEAQKALVRTALDAGKPETALQSLRPLLREYPQDPQIQNLMGLTQLALRNPDRATRHFIAAYKQDKQGIYALNLSSAYIEGGEYEKAIKLLQAYLKPVGSTSKEGEGGKNYPYRERMYHNIGYANLKLNKLTKAEDWFQEALDENPTFFPSYMELARIYETSKRTALALKTYRRSVDFCHVCFEPVYSSSMLLMQMNRHQEARKMLVRFLKTDGINQGDKSRADQLLKLVVTASVGAKPGQAAQ